MPRHIPRRYLWLLRATPATLAIVRRMAADVAAYLGRRRRHGQHLPDPRSDARAGSVPNPGSHRGASTAILRRRFRPSMVMLDGHSSPWSDRGETPWLSARAIRC